MSLEDIYRGKKVLITGTTGFLGKVLLEKFLFNLSCVDKIYIVIRSKQGSDLYERFKKEIVSSPCFDRIRKVHQNRFDQFFQSKVQPIKGDLQKQNLGFSPQDYKYLKKNLNIVINCAASIDFNARIDHAIDSNINGSLRMMRFAQQVQNLDVMTHISTCYVNCNLRGLIKEEIYDKDIDADEEYESLMKMQQTDLIAQTDKILDTYPNTYTFTKALCERMMKKHKGNLPLTLIRPAIINTSLDDPFPGWLDSIAAAAALFLFVGLGIVREVKGNANKIGDIIPVDYVVNNIIVATARNFKNEKLPIYHVGSSDRNPLTWGEMKNLVVNYWNTNVSKSRVAQAKVTISDNDLKLKMKSWQRKLPVWMYEKVSPYMRPHHVKNAQRMKKTMERGEEIEKIFKFFILNQWIYESRNINDLLTFLNAKDRQDFHIDIAEIDMKRYINICNYGLQKFILKENVELPDQKNSNLLKAYDEGSYFSDIKWVMNTSIPLNKNKMMPEMKIKILKSTRILNAIQQQAAARFEKQKVKIDQMKKIVRAEALKIIEQMVGEIRLPVLRFMAYTLKKVFTNMYQKVNVDMSMFDRIRQIQQKNGVPIVLMPTHKSYLDFLIVSYIFFIYKLKLPYIVSDENLLQANLLPFLIKSSGAFFFKRKQYKNSRLYQVIFDKYVELLLKEGNNLEFFIEGTRSRTGKILEPRFEMLNILLNAVMYGKVNDICLVPITINYEKVLESDTFPSELLGEQKVSETLIRTIKAIPVLRQNYGRVYVEICEPFFLKQHYEGFINRQPQKIDNKLLKAKIIEDLGKEVIRRMTQRLVIMSTGIVSSVLLMNRKGISQEQLIKTVNQISKYILKKGYKIGGLNENSSTIAVRNAIGYLSEITSKTKKDIFELQIQAGNQFQKTLMLSYYRNNIIHAFLPQAFIGCVMASFGTQLNSKQGIKLQRVYEESNFLLCLLQQEYYLDYSLKNYQEFEKIIEMMQKFLILVKKDNDKVIIVPSADRMIGFYTSLLLPLIECHWSCLIYIMTICRNEGQKSQTISLQKFFDTIQWYIQSLFAERVIEHNEASSLVSIKNAFRTFEKLKIVKIQKGSKKKDAVVQVCVSIQKLQELERRIKFFKKSVIHNSILSPMELAKSSLKDLNLSKL